MYRFPDFDHLVLIATPNDLLNVMHIIIYPQAIRIPGICQADSGSPD